jgi:hypothetical protein
MGILMLAMSEAVFVNVYIRAKVKAIAELMESVVRLGLA